ncbi:MAG TPA: membrane protein insertion efficiency factor YidD [Chloroflexi bacterium]|jgi:putative component of membrane protein insertase Oxa1/YidC/SpoIIIJ protein YidD|nr:membrane protein insertion efficiency factor YidD [Chloroflexota bacterium]
MAPIASGDHQRAVAVILFALFMYQHSLQHWWLHRKTAYRCRFIPSCTEYAVRAVDKYGFSPGLLLIGDRFRRCNPMFEGDYVDFP